MSQIKIVILTTLFFSLLSNAQNYDFGKVSKEELIEQSYPLDSSAVAAYLYKYRKSYYVYSQNSGLSLVTEIHERIKVYDKAGFDHATKIINLSKGIGSAEVVSKIKGYTYSLVNGEIVETKLEKDGIFKSEFSKGMNQVKLTMPKVKEGSVLEYRYKVISPYYSSIDEFRFQEAIPIKRLKASMAIFDYFRFNQRQKGFLPLNPKTDRVMNNQVGTYDVVTSYNLVNVPALIDESFVSNIDNYRSGVDFEIVSVQFPGEMSENFAKSWEDVVATIYKNTSFGNELEKKNFFEDDLDNKLKGIADKKQRLKEVLTFVKDKIKWNKNRGVTAEEGVKKAYKSGVGNSGDINLFLVSCLKHAGFDAYPIILSTRDHGVQLFPTLKGFNYVIAGIKDGESYSFLDATEKYSMVNVLPMRDLNWFGRAINKDGTAVMVDLLPAKMSKEITMLNLVLGDDLSFEGSVKQRYSDYYAMLLRDKYNAETEVEYIQELEDKYSGIEISNFEIKEVTQPNKIINQAYEIYLDESIDDAGDKLYFSPLLHLSQDESPFKSEIREFPVDFGYPWEDSFIVNITLPENYTIATLPENKMISLPNKLGFFNFQISTLDNTLQISSKISFKKALISNDHYAQLKEFYCQIVEKHSEKVVLQRI
ncbi:transglutaminase [Maribacter sp.]|uniref:transglutaminase n=1 Tax=Maribacter sp. TaxID=1897614 RepID=UPI0025BA5926|nr:transglutaminase [Maribacter sp.]